MSYTPQRIPSRSQTPSPPPPFGPRPDPKSLSTPSLHGPDPPRRTISQNTITPLPQRLRVSSTTPTTISPTSSIINLELNEGIILRDAGQDEGDTAENEAFAQGIFAMSQDGDDERKKALRDQLRKTLTQKGSKSGPSPRSAHQKDNSGDVEEMSLAQESLEPLYPRREYFVITDAGKPVFVSRPPIANNDLTSITGIIAALISVFADNTLSPSSPPSLNIDKLRCINAGSTRITFLLRPPLYYVCVSKWREPESITRMHLNYLHMQILSILTASHLRRVFERRTNFDLRRLLEGAESFLHALILRLQLPLAFCVTLSALSSLRLDTSLRSRVGKALLPNSKTKDMNILYIILVSGDNIVTLIRPRKHSVHPVDLHILFNALHNPSIATNPASWLPICLPKFNPQGFVHAYVSFLDQEQFRPVIVRPNSVGESGGMREHLSGFSNVNDADTMPPPSGPSTSKIPQLVSPANDPHSHSNVIDDLQAVASTGNIETDTSVQSWVGNQEADYASGWAPRNGLTLVVVSGGGEFDAVRNWCETISKKLETAGTLSLLQNAVKSAPYTCSELGIPGLRHFMYKSRVHVQVTYPTWDEEHYTLDNQRRLITLYQTLHDTIHAKSGQEKGLKSQYIRTDREAVMGWITQPFELYVALSPRLPKTAVVSAANAVARWVKREEPKLFLRDAPVF